MLARTRRRVRRVGFVLLDHTGTHVLLAEDRNHCHYTLPVATMDENVDVNGVYTAFRAYVNATRLQMPALETRTIRHFTADDGTEFIVARMTTPWPQYVHYMMGSIGTRVPIYWLPYAGEEEAGESPLQNIPAGLVLSTQAQAYLAFMRSIPELEPSAIQSTLHAIASHPHTVHGRDEPDARVVNRLRHFSSHAAEHDLGEESWLQPVGGRRRHYHDLCGQIRDAVALVQRYRQAPQAAISYL